jgi:hypothetical protein
MKISQKSNRELREILLRVLPHIEGLLDEAAAFNAARGKGLSEVEATDRGIKLTKDLLDAILRRRYDAIMAILAALRGVAVSQMDEMPFGETLALVAEVLCDEGLWRFFPSFERWVQAMSFDILPK